MKQLLDYWIGACAFGTRSLEPLVFILMGVRRVQLPKQNALTLREENVRNLLNFIMVCFVLLENPIHLLRFSNGRCTGFSNKTLRKENVSKFYCHIKILNCARLLYVRRGFHRAAERRRVPRHGSRRRARRRTQ